MTQTNNNTLGPMVDGRNVHHGRAQTSPTCSTTSEINVARRNKRLPSETEKSVYTENNKVTTVRGKVKRKISDNQYAQIIHKAMQVEKTLGGCQPGILDFLCYGITTDEINSAWDDLQWLYPDFDKKGPVAVGVPEMVVAA